MKIPTEHELEIYLQTILLPDLEMGRSNWDAPHTLLVVEELKQILEHAPELDLDRIVLLITAYTHDWGYTGLFAAPGYSLDDVMRQKALHMEIGAEKTETLLEEPIFAFLRDAQKRRIVELVRIHDKLDSLHEQDELAFMEADTLGALAMDRKRSNFSREDELAYLMDVEQKRLPFFLTEYGKQRAVARIAEIREGK